MRCRPQLRARIRLLDPPAHPSAAYDAGLRALGLLDFIRLDLRSSGAVCREDVADLIANYDEEDERSLIQKGPIEVSCSTFAEALCLPAPGRTASSYIDSAVVAFAATEFMKAYFVTPLQAGGDRNREVASEVRVAAEMVMDGRAPAVDWTELIWVVVKTEMFELSEGRRSNSACYYGAYLQRLIRRKWPDLVQPPPSMPTSALHPQRAQRNKQSAINAKKKQLELDYKMKDLFGARYMQLEARLEG